MPKAINIYPDTQIEARVIQREFISLISHWIRNYKTRKSLHGMDNHLLQDIGIDRAQAEAEARKPFWR